MSENRVGIVGAGPGGLTSAMILAHRGGDVTVFERRDRVGGRNAPLELGEYTFDTGPTFLMMKFILEEMFGETGRDVEDYLDFVRLDPLYRLKMGEKELFPAADPERTRKEVERLFPGNAEGVDLFMEKEGKRFERLLPCLQKEYGSLLGYLRPMFLKALPRMSLGKTIFQNLDRYFDDDELKLCFAFQSK
ncbi:MAG: NAD(P)-binding protein, partial [Planctomycetes bacterium]|nr:NAD(P)-binding protein [Planctomycetota bacterium]